MTSTWMGSHGDGGLGGGVCLSKLPLQPLGFTLAFLPLARVRCCLLLSILGRCQHALPDKLSGFVLQLQLSLELCNFPLKPRQFAWRSRQDCGKVRVTNATSYFVCVWIRTVSFFTYSNVFMCFLPRQVTNVLAACAVGTCVAVSLCRGRLWRASSTRTVFRFTVSLLFVDDMPPSPRPDVPGFPAALALSVSFFLLFPASSVLPLPMQLPASSCSPSLQLR